MKRSGSTAARRRGRTHLRATIEDVARVAGVSASSVSRALSGSTTISARTKRRIARVARRLGYVPNQTARSLVTRASRIFGLIIPDVTDPIHGQFVTGFEQAAAAYGYSVIMVNGFRTPQYEERGLKLFAAHQAAGVALMGCVLAPTRVRAMLRPTPVVFANAEHPRLAGYESDPPIGCIRADDVSGMFEVVRHLLERGYRRLAYLNGSPWASNLTRRDTVRRALKTISPSLKLREYYSDGGPDTGDVVAKIIRDRPDALICYDDKLALSMLDALSIRGIRVPADVAVVGFDDVPFAAIANPRLTTVSQPTVDMGRLAVAILRQAIETGGEAPSHKLPVRLIIRESTVPRA